MVGPRRAKSGPRGTARDRALRLLGVRWRSREELRRRLMQAGFPGPEVEVTLDDLAESQLIDDARFAVEVVKDQANLRGSGNRAIRSALVAKGVEADVVSGAMASLDDETARARELAARKALRMRGLSSDVAFRRLSGFLIRRGYGSAIAFEASRSALLGGLSDQEAELYEGD